MSDLMIEALSLMAVGMGFVFVFLTILVGVTAFMSKMVNKYAPAPAPVKPAVAPVTASAPIDTKMLAVLQEAVNTYRADKNR